MAKSVITRSKIKKPINRSFSPPLIGLLITLSSDWLAYWFAMVTEITSVASID